MDMTFLNSLMMPMMMQSLLGNLSGNGQAPAAPKKPKAEEGGLESMLPLLLMLGGGALGNIFGGGSGQGSQTYGGSPNAGSLERAHWAPAQPQESSTPEDDMLGLVFQAMLQQIMPQKTGTETAK